MSITDLIVAGVYAKFFAERMLQDSLDVRENHLHRRPVVPSVEVGTPNGPSDSISRRLRIG